MKFEKNQTKISQVIAYIARQKRPVSRKDIAEHFGAKNDQEIKQIDGLLTSLRRMSERRKDLPVEKVGKGQWTARRADILGNHNRNQTETMRTTIEINANLLNKAMSLAGSSSKKQTVEVALREYVRAKQRVELAELIGRYDDFDLDLTELERMRRGR